MITAKLTGGLGNLMFEIAATCALALRNNASAVFDLEAHQIDNQGCSASKYKNTILRNLKTAIIPFETWGAHNYSEPEFSYNPIPFIEPSVLCGYWQSEKYFEDCKQYTRNLFHISAESMNKVDGFLGSLPKGKAVTTCHFRKGDYANFPHIYYIQEKSYYEEAMKLFPDNTFVFLSDDLQWCKDNFQGDNIFFSPFTDELDDLTLMIMADNCIIANSSFSWWGAWLNYNENKKVVAPKKWFKVGANLDTKDLYCKEWDLL